MFNIKFKNFLEHSLQFVIYELRKLILTKPYGFSSPHALHGEFPVHYLPLLLARCHTKTSICDCVVTHLSRLKTSIFSHKMRKMHYCYNDCNNDFIMIKFVS